MPRSALVNIMIQTTTHTAKNITQTLNQIANRKNINKENIYKELQNKIITDYKKNLQKIKPKASFYSPLDNNTNDNNKKKEYQWFINPLDGKDNFFAATPLFATSIALAHNDELIAAIIYNPLSEELFSTEKGKGAFCNDKRIRISETQDINHAIIATQNKPYTKKTRIIDCTALNLAFTAIGRFDGYIGQNHTIYEIAAGLMMVREAGGFALPATPHNSIYESGTIIAANEFLCKNLCKIKIEKNK